MFCQRNLGGRTFFSFSEFDEYPDFTYVVTTRLDLGKLPLESPAEAHAPLLNALRIQGEDLVLLRQVHGSDTIVLPRNYSGSKITELGPADGIINDQPGFFCAIRTADCVPVVAVAPGKRAFAIFHAGWRGTSERIIEKGIARLLEHTGAQSHEVLVSLGPCIRKCCYQVGGDVIAAFRASDQGQSLVDNRHLDLVAANRDQIRSLGVSRILDSGICTCCRVDRFYSYRRERTDARTLTLAGFQNSTALRSGRTSKGLTLEKG